MHVCFTEMDEHGNLVKRIRKKGEKADDEESLYDYVSHDYLTFLLLTIDENVGNIIVCRKEISISSKVGKMIMMSFLP